MTEKNQIIAPPQAEKRPYFHEKFGEKRSDPYAWIRDRDDPKTIQYLNSENSYLEAVLKPDEDTRSKLFEEIKKKINENDQSAPVKIDEYYYYEKISAGQQYEVQCRRHESMGNAEEILLDLNLLAKGRTYLSVSDSEVSPNHRFLAYSADFDGSEKYTIRIKDLTTGLELSDEIPNTHGSLVWGPDSKTIFYAVLDSNMRPYRAYAHEMGTAHCDDVLLFEELDSKYFLGVSETSSEEYLSIEIGGHETSESWYLKYSEFFKNEKRFCELDSLKKGVRCFQKRIHGHEYQFEHVKNAKQDEFYVLTNSDAKNFKVSKTSINDTDMKNWIDLVPHRDDVMIEGIEVFEAFWVITERENGLEKIRIMSHDDPVNPKYIDFDEEAYSVSSDENPNYKTADYRYGYESFITPDTVYQFNIETSDRTTLKQTVVPGGYRRENYFCERIFAESLDGKKIPISLFYKKGFKKDGSSPLYLYAYGSYGYSVNAGFRVSRFSLVDRGFCFAVAHIRGGSELGREWYESAKFLTKKRTFTDYIDCAEHLIKNNYTNSGQIVACGGSAGGMLMGVTLNERPELFKAVIAHVPFVDVLTTMLDDNLPLTQMEYDEWGNPNDREYYNYILSYSPYDNLKTGDLPHVLVTAGLNDPRVTFWEPAKWVARARELKNNTKMLLLHTNMDAGHGGASGRYDSIKDIALDFTFILKAFGIPF